MSELVVGRYRIVEFLGRGAQGEVHRALDEITGLDVAIKSFEPARGARLGLVLEEGVALRMLRMPRVASILDQGEYCGRDFVVMELVRGTPFPGRPRPAPWDEVATTVRTLLETVDAIHCAGLAHGDLKPANVLVDADALPTILDFGIARRLSARVDDPTKAGGGTPAYIAPELIRGMPASPASDLYAIGVMVYEALCGAVPHGGGSTRSLFLGRLTSRARPIRDLAPCIPDTVAATLDALLERDPTHRPASARAALQMLWRQRAPGEAAHGPSLARPDGEPGDLASLFVGDERLLHLRSDAACALTAAAGHERACVSEILERWVARGIARPTGTQFHVSREALAYLTTRDIPVRDGEPVAARALRSGLRALDEGDAARAIAFLEESARATRGSDASPDPALFVAWLEAVVSEQSAREADRLRYELTRTDGTGPLERIVDALAIAVIELSADPVRALERLDVLGPMPIPALERARSMLRMVASRSGTVADEDRVLADIAVQVDRHQDVALHAHLDGWRGRAAYRRGSYFDARTLHLRSARALTRPAEIAAALLHAAAASLDAFRLDEVCALVDEARALLRSRRLPFLEARAEWLARTAHYRMRRPLAPDLELVESAGLLGVTHVEAQIAFTEAAFAWRAGETSLAVSLAERAESLWRRTRTLVEFAWLARALALVSGHDPRERDIDELVEHALRAQAPGAGIQTLGLVALAGAPLSRAHRPQIERLARTIAPEHHGIRIDVLSVAESLQALGA